MMERTVAIVQARLGSQRLPAKVLMPVLGKPILWHLVDRLRHAKAVDEIVIATTVEARDEAIATFSADHDIHCFRGDEQDVLDRYYQAATTYHAATVVRITADCPLIDPVVVDGVIDLRFRSGVDYASNVAPPTFPDGLDVEVMTMRALEKAWREADIPYQREHVTSYITEHPELFTTSNLSNDRDLSPWRLTVDEKEDMEVVSAVFEGLYSKERVFSLDEIVSFIEKTPGLLEKNKQFLRNENYQGAQ